MNNAHHNPLRSAVGLLVMFALGLSSTRADRPWSRSSDGRIIVRPAPTDDRFKNLPWPEAWEEAYQDRATYVIQQTARAKGFGSTWFENEKRSYGWAMLSILGGYEDAGLSFLQSEDAAPKIWNQHTLGIDYFPCFTLKHQIRKYFYFGDYLAPEYRARMREAARRFTEIDPLHRSNPAYTGQGVWGPDAKNSWVDVRSTDNLKLMRETSVYLLAEETGNDATRQLYQKRLTDFIVTMYYAGQGEWDSENYLGHGIAPLLNLYDFAKDEQVKGLAKAALDRMATDAAVKYYRGAFNGPTRRDYNHPYPFGGSAAALAWLWFGDSPQRPEAFESDEIHLITSSYRPPAAVVHLARKEFAKPCEIYAGKPEWAAWERPNAEQPSFRETQYFGRTFQLGSLARGTQQPDINGFKMLAFSSQRGADTLVAAPTTDVTKIGSPQYQDGILAEPSVVGQHRNVAIYLTAEHDHPFLWLVPTQAKVTPYETVTLVELERTSVAIWPINTSPFRLDETRTETAQFVETRNKQGQVSRKPRWPDAQVLSAYRSEEGIYGFAIEVCEADRDAFHDWVQTHGPDVSQLATQRQVSLTGRSGPQLTVRWGVGWEDLRIWRDGKLRNWEDPSENQAYRSITGKLVNLPWQGDGTLVVQAGGAIFHSRVTRNGVATFREQNVAAR